MTNLQKCRILITLQYARKKSLLKGSSDCVFMSVGEVQANILSNMLNYMRVGPHISLTEDAV